MIKWICQGNLNKIKKEHISICVLSAYRLLVVHYPKKDGAIFMISTIIKSWKNIIPKSNRIIKSFLLMKPPPCL